jgi:pimeloyl-ACP methyl ester carboxylesterase
VTSVPSDAIEFSTSQWATALSPSYRRRTAVTKGNTATSMSNRIEVERPGQARLAVWVEGSGPPIVLVHGSMSEHRTFDALVAELQKSFTTFAMDRRGFGDSPEIGEYSAEREFDDVAAVADAVSARMGRPVVLFGHSWGASCAIGGAARSRNLSHLVLYEPSLGLKYPPGAIAEIEAQVAAGDAEAAILSVLVGLGGMTPEQVDAMRSSSTWPARLLTAPTIAREARIENGWVHKPGEFQGITAPTLFLVGAETTPELAEVTAKCAEAIPNAIVRTLAGHGHFAYKTHPAAIAAIIGEFARDDRRVG